MQREIFSVENDSVSNIGRVGVSFCGQRPPFRTAHLFSDTKKGLLWRNKCDKDKAGATHKTEKEKNNTLSLHYLALSHSIPMNRFNSKTAHPPDDKNGLIITA